MKRERVEVEVEFVDLPGDYGDVPGVRVTCTGCDHEVECFGQESKSVRRACVMLNEECPRGEDNYYHCEEANE